MAFFVLDKRISSEAQLYINISIISALNEEILYFRALFEGFGAGILHSPSFEEYNRYPVFDIEC